MEQSARDRILAKALELFYDQGIHNTGINQIIAESATAKASFYQYFPSKHDLVRACLSLYGQAVATRLEEAARSSTGFDDFVARWIDVMTESRSGGREYRGCPVANARFSITREADERYEDAFREIVNGWLSLLEGLLSDFRQRGFLSPEADTNLLARRMIHLWEGAVVMWKLTGDRGYFRDLAALAKILT